MKQHDLMARQTVLHGKTFASFLLTAVKSHHPHHTTRKLLVIVVQFASFITMKFQNYAQLPVKNHGLSINNGCLDDTAREKKTFTIDTTKHRRHTSLVTGNDTAQETFLLMGPVRIRHSSRDFGWQDKMASVKFWIQ